MMDAETTDRGKATKRDAESLDFSEDENVQQKPKIVPATPTGSSSSAETTAASKLAMIVRQQEELQQQSIFLANAASDLQFTIGTERSLADAAVATANSVGTILNLSTD